jgi:hypothetical protein
MKGMSDTPAIPRYRYDMRGDVPIESRFRNDYDY